MYGASCVVEHLLFGQKLDGFRDLLLAQPEACAHDVFHVTLGFLNGFNAAKSATDGSGKAATARFEAVIGRILQADLDVEAKLQILDMNALDLAGRSDNAFRQAEAQGEI